MCLSYVGHKISKTGCVREEVPISAFPLRFEIAGFLVHLNPREGELVSQDISTDVIRRVERNLSLVLLGTGELRLGHFFPITRRADIRLHIITHDSIFKRLEFRFEASILEAISIREARSVTGTVRLLFGEIKRKICRD